MTTQRERAQMLRRLHRPGDPLVLVNVWDAASARIVEDLGFPALATTSAGIAWLEGFADGERISRERMLAGVRRVTEAVHVPVTADLEAAYGPTTQDAAATAAGAIEAGAAGLNFEDWDAAGDRLTGTDAQCERIAAMRDQGVRAGVALVINARTDVFLRDVGAQERRIDEAIARGNAYLQAGADCVFVPGVTDERTIESLAASIEGPLNVLAGASSPTVGRLAQLGVARISVGSAAMAVTLAHLREGAQSLQETGSFAFAAGRIGHADVNALFSR